MLPILLIQCQHECRKHGKDHKQRGGRVPQGFLCEKEQGDAHKQPRAEAYQLTLGQVEQHLGLNFCQVFGNGYIGHGHTSLMGIEYGTGKAAGFEQAEAEQHGIAHAGPDGGTNVAGYGNVLYQH